MKNLMPLVFVYGTLRVGQPNFNRYLMGSEIIAKAVLTAPKYKIVSLGGFPGMFEGGTRVVHGDIFRVSSATLKDLDRLEGHPNFYERKEVSLAKPMSEPVFAYFLPRDDRHYENAPEIISGDWLQEVARRSSNVRRSLVRG